MREQINLKQRENVFSAYRKCNVDRDYLDTIYENGVSQKVSLSELFGTDTLVFERPLSAVELNALQLLSDTADRFPDYSFSWGNKSVTERSTGHCMPLKKFSEKNGLDYAELNDLCEKKITLVLSCNPWFLIGSSVAANGWKLDSSCHYPDGSYASGAISYALDRHTVVACRWDGEGITGRMLIHIDIYVPGIVTGRHYGDFTSADASFIRKQIYTLFNGFKTSDWKKTEAFTVNTRGFCGYSDSSYFEGYRPQRHQSIEICLVAPICPSCGDRHNAEEISCCAGKHVCCDCGARLHEDDAYFNNYGDCYCDSCFSEHYTYCDHCGETVVRDDICETNNGDCYCTSCAERKGYVLCYECGKWSQDYTFNASDDEYYCDRCLPSGATCEHCCDYFEDCDIVTAVNGDTYCESCADSQLDKCDACGNYTTAASETGDGYTVCEECSEKLRPCEHCGEVYTDGRVTEQNPVCCRECATAQLFGEAA